MCVGGERGAATDGEFQAKFSPFFSPFESVSEIARLERASKLQFVFEVPLFLLPLPSMLKRAAEERYVPPVPLKRRSIEIDASLRAEWRNAEQHQQQQGRATPSAPRHSAAASASVTTTTATVADAFSGLTADDW